jgi:hypothetical protein
MGWSDYRKFVDVEWRKIPTNPGVYYIRYVNESGKPVSVQRLGGVDKEGIVYVGETGNSLRKRLRDFWKTAHNFRVDRHRAGWNYSYYGFNKIFPLKNLQFSYLSCKSKAHSQSLEFDCLWEYRKTKRYIDLPPLNFSAGKEK